MRRGRATACVFDDSHYARGPARKLARALQLGPRYYLWDLPRYFSQRRGLGLPWWDGGAVLNPLWELRGAGLSPFPPPPRYTEALRRLGEAGVRVTLPPARLSALVGAWWSAREAGGAVIECGSYRGATGLLLALLGHIHGLRQLTLLLDTFAGSPPSCRHDLSRRGGEFTPAEGQVYIIQKQAAGLDVQDRVEVHQGLFADIFRRLQDRDLRLAFVHIDANLYQSTLEACAFALPRTSPGCVVVFDDYNGVCDLGARLAVDHYFAGKGVKPLPLAGSSAFVRIAPRRSS